MRPVATILGIVGGPLGIAFAQANAPASLGIGALGGVIGISCCVSPVVLYLVGVASATEVVGLDLFVARGATNFAPLSLSSAAG